MKTFFLEHVYCTNVIDGDTIDVEIDVGFDFKTKQRLRLLGVDTPERGDPGFVEATKFVIEFCLDREIQIRTYEKDSFGRWLADVFADEVFLNGLLLEEGLAAPY
jgi:micrococcal nuclease